MARQQTRAGDARPLDILDIDATEERAYRWLLAHPGATVQEIAQALPLPQRKAQQLLDSMESKGLATYSPQRPRRYVPASPNIAMEALVLERLDALQRARAAIQELQEQAAQQQGEQEQLVELITSREAAGQAFDHLQSTAQHEVVVLMRLPILISRVDTPHDQGQKVQRKAQAKGVRYRSIVDAVALAAPGVVDLILSDVKAGEDVRVVPSLPFKMALADRRVAFIPMNLERQDNPAFLLVRSSALVDALYALFELLWERAVPIAFTGGGELGLGEANSELSEQARALVSLMAAGLPDKVIAHELGMSASTLNRRVVEIMDVLDAQTRFQFGWLSALRLSGQRQRR